MIKPVREGRLLDVLVSCGSWTIARKTIHFSFNRRMNTTDSISENIPALHVVVLRVVFDINPPAFRIHALVKVNEATSTRPRNLRNDTRRQEKRTPDTGGSTLRRELRLPN